MKTAIISPHTDDALFSLGSFMPTLENVTIISPFAGIPDEEVGRMKHTTLRNEHRLACAVAGVEYVNGDFFDDVYGKQNREDVIEWLSNEIRSFDKIYVPLGIHHPDHIFIRDIFIEYFDFTGFYAELPYRVLYPDLYAQMVQKHTTEMRQITSEHLGHKQAAVEMYDSQIAPHLLPQLYVEEFIWSKE